MCSLSHRAWFTSLWSFISMVVHIDYRRQVLSSSSSSSSISPSSSNSSTSSSNAFSYINTLSRNQTHSLSLNTRYPCNVQVRFKSTGILSGSKMLAAHGRIGTGLSSHQSCICMPRRIFLPPSTRAKFV